MNMNASIAVPYPFICQRHLGVMRGISISNIFVDMSNTNLGNPLMELVPYMSISRLSPESVKSEFTIGK